MIEAESTWMLDASKEAKYTWQSEQQEELEKKTSLRQ